MMPTTYEVNANGNRTYANASAAKVADVATTWSAQGHEPQAYAVIVGDLVRIVRVSVTTKAATKAALLAAR